MSKNEKLKKNPVRPLSPLVVPETFSILRIPIELVFGESEYRLKQHCVSSFARTKGGRSYNYAFLLKPAEILIAEQTAAARSGPKPAVLLGGQGAWIKCNIACPKAGHDPAQCKPCGAKRRKIGR